MKLFVLALEKTSNYCNTEKSSYLAIPCHGTTMQSTVLFFCGEHSTRSSSVDEHKRQCFLKRRAEGSSSHLGAMLRNTATSRSISLRIFAKTKFTTCCNDCLEGGCIETPGQLETSNSTV